MTLALVALRSALFAAGFLWLWTWVALQLRPFDPALGGPLPPMMRGFASIVQEAPPRAPLARSPQGSKIDKRR